MIHQQRTQLTSDCNCIPCVKAAAGLFISGFLELDTAAVHPLIAGLSGDVAVSELRISASFFLMSASQLYKSFMQSCISVTLFRTFSCILIASIFEVMLKNIEIEVLFESLSLVNKHLARCAYAVLLRCTVPDPYNIFWYVPQPSALICAPRIHYLPILHCSHKESHFFARIASPIFAECELDGEQCLNIPIYPRQICSNLPDAGTPEERQLAAQVVSSSSFWIDEVSTILERQSCVGFRRR
jgi:hypothetical protein